MILLFNESTQIDEISLAGLQGGGKKKCPAKSQALELVFVRFNDS